MAKDVLFFTLMYLLTVFSVRDLLHLQLSSLPAAFLIHSQHSVVVVFCIFGNSSTQTLYTPPRSSYMYLYSLAKGPRRGKL